ncbi:MAG TPA: pyridoxal phosphate-dependent aminotransferase [Gammaproteobacteria bacterium]|nr:pyridoxal phosphate-dependent aminotransferase [Gammaproteobacteria bacterium]
MTISLSDRVQQIQPSPTLAVTARAAALRAAGQDVIGLGAGEPDFDTPAHIKQAAIAALEKGATKYTPVEGIAPLKDAIRNKFKRDNGLDYAADQILVSAGAKQTLFNLAQALLNPGDEAIIPAPYWVSYPAIVSLAGAKPVIVSAGIEDRFKITPDKLAATITDRTRLIILNTPSNPTGIAYTRAELAALGEVLKAYPDIVIATDDIYEQIVWTEEPFTNLVMACPELYDRTVVVNGVSKTYAMTGWRIGYCGGPKPLVQAMKKVQSQSTSGANSIAQAAAVAAIDGDQSCIEPMVRAFKERHDYVVEALNALPGIRCLTGDGTFYAFADCREAIAQLDGIDDDVQLSEALIERCGVALVPGSAFGAPGYARITFATSMEQLRSAMQRLAKVFAKEPVPG